MANILVIDDDPSVLSFMSSCFHGQHEVQAFPNWSSAMPSLSRVNFDLALIDLNLTGFQGNDIVTLLRGQFSGKIYLFSAADKDKVRKITRDCGADGFIEKVLSAEHLKVEVSQALFKHSSGKSSGRFPKLPTQTPKRPLKRPNTNQLYIRSADKNAFLIEDLVRRYRDLSKADFLEQVKSPALLQLNQYEVISTHELLITNANQPDKLPRLDPKKSILFFLQAKDGSPKTRDIVVGRAEEADIVIRSERVSKLHASFQQGEDGEWQIKDLESMNGTYVNNQILSSGATAPLRRGSALAFSESLGFKFLKPDELYIRIRMYRSIF